MQNKFLALCAVAALFVNPGVAQAQVGNGGAQYSDVNSKNQWAQFMPKFVEATGDTISAQAHFLFSVGMKDQADALALQAKELSSVAAPGLIEQIMASRTRVSGALLGKLAAGGVTLDAAAKQQFGQGIEILARGIKQYDEISADLPDTKRQLRGAGDKARGALFVAKSLPNYVKEAKQELAAAITFARANEILFPAEAAAALAP